MKLELSRSRVWLLSALAENQAQRLIEPGALKDGLFQLAAELKQMADAHAQANPVKVQN